jgi:hypothetical protein
MSNPEQDTMRTFQQLGDAILQYLRDGQEHEFHDVVASVRKSGIENSAIKATIWRLYSEGQVELTPEWRLRKPISEPAAIGCGAS